MNKLLQILLLGSLFSFSSAHSLTIYKQDFPDQLSATDISPELYLRGASVRKVYGIVNTYIGLLYVADKNIPSDEIIDADISRRMEFHLISNRVTSRRFINVIEEGLALNTSREQMEAIEPRVQKLFELFDYKFVKGTVGFIEWVPSEQVSRIVINDTVRGSVPGKDLSDALLSIWIGEHPVSGRFKEQIMGLASSD